MRWTLPIVAAVLLLAGCSHEDGSDRTPPESPSATLGFTQLVSQEGTSQALVRTTNTGAVDLQVRSAVIDWPGYPDGRPTPTDSTIAVDGTLDLRVALPVPACDADADADEPASAVIETAQGEIRRELTPSGQTYLRRVWRTQCGEQAVRDAVDVSYSRDWAVVGEGADARALGHLVLRRGAGDEEVEVTEVDGSVLHGLRLPGVSVLEPGAGRVRIPLEITPGERCDEHARGQATAPFAFSMELVIGDHDPVSYPLEVPQAAAGAATRALDIACLARR